MADDANLRTVLHREGATKVDLVLMVQGGAPDVLTWIVVVIRKPVEEGIRRTVCPTSVGRNDAGQVVGDLNVALLDEGCRMRSHLPEDNLECVVAGTADRQDEVAGAKQRIRAREGRAGGWCESLLSSRVSAEVFDARIQTRRSEVLNLGTRGDGAVDGSGTEAARAASVRRSCGDSILRCLDVQVTRGADVVLVNNLTNLEGCVVHIIAAQDRALENFPLHTEVPLLRVGAAVRSTIGTRDGEVLTDKAGVGRSRVFCGICLVVGLQLQSVRRSGGDGSRADVLDCARDAIDSGGSYSGPIRIVDRPRPADALEVVERTRGEQTCAGVCGVVEHVALKEESESSTERGFMISGTVREADLRGEVSVRLVDLLPKIRAPQAEQRCASRARDGAGGEVCRCDLLGEGRCMVLIGATSVDSPTDAGGEGEARPYLPGVLNVGTFSPVRR